MKKILFLAITLVFAFGACRKASTPSRVNRLLAKGTWKVEKMVDSTVNISKQFENLTFVFDSDRTLTAKGDSIIKGVWDVPSKQRDPAELIIYLPENSQIKPISDDWLVVFLTKNEFRLERLNGKKGATDECIFVKL